MKELLSKMTLREKVGQLNQRLYGWQVYQKTDNGIELTDYFKDEVARFGSIGTIYGVFRADPWSEKNQYLGLTIEESKQVSRMIQEYLQAHTRLKIPAFLSEECPHGHQGLESTTTPANISVGASWNPQLYQEVETIVAEEIREKGAHLGLISTLDVSRDPRWGRTEECFSEDPYLTSQFTEAAVIGLQGEKASTIESNKVLAVLKHLAAQGDAMGGHNAGPVNIGERELREIHLPAVIAGISAGAQLVMAAYNDIDGVPCHINQWLLTKILREEMGFLGAVMADGCALDRVAELMGSRIIAAATALESGVDISLWDNIYPELEKAVLQGLLSEEQLNQSVLRILKLKEQMGLFESTEPLVSTLDSQKKRQLVTQLAEESTVLLKNNGILPLNKKEKQTLAVIGPHVQNVYHQLGDYTPFKIVDHCSNLIQGLDAVTAGTEVSYLAEAGCAIAEPLLGGLERAIAAAKAADKIIVTIGGSSTRDFGTEFDANGAALSGSKDMTSGENIDLADLEIPECQQILVNELSKLGKPLIGIVIAGRPMVLSQLESKFSALFFAGYPGQYGGDALANLLFGEVTPSGKLAMSFPDANGQLPVYYNYRNAAFKKDYADLVGRPTYAFGYGLSYATFEVTEMIVELDQTLSISGTLANSSTFAGSEVVQVYISEYSKDVIPRNKRLCNFEKIFISSQSETDFKLEISKTELTTYGIDMTVEALNNFKLEIVVANQSYHYQIENFQSAQGKVKMLSKP